MRNTPPQVFFDGHLFALCRKWLLKDETTHRNFAWWRITTVRVPGREREDD
jgi:hypothetical protein